MEALRFVFSSFWIWLGFVLILYIPIEAIVKIISRLIRRSMITKQGWPPVHLDADGDWNPEPKDKE
jgi:hypothetical protein